MLRPKVLKPGDRVALIAPSSPVDEEKLQLSLESVYFLGLNPVLFPSCSMKHGYLSGTDEARARDINNAFLDPEIAAVFCIRGGYGATRLLPALDFEGIGRNPKLFLGYSDITAFHTVFNRLCGFATLHCPMPSRGYATMDYLSLDSLSASLFSTKPQGKASLPEGQFLKTLVPGRAEGRMTGGNLSLLTATLGSPYEVDARGKILFIEEVDEEPYKIDRSLTALSLAGKFRDCCGIVLGSFSGCEEKEGADGLCLAQIFEEVIKPFGKPAVMNFPAGHSYPHVAIPMGGRALLDAQEGALFFLDAAVSN